MKLTIAVIAMMVCMAHSVPVPEPEESIDLVKIPLSGNKVSSMICSFSYHLSFCDDDLCNIDMITTRTVMNN